jgi:hypothetical protein
MFIDPLGDPKDSLKTTWSKINMSYVLSLKNPVGKIDNMTTSHKNLLGKMWGESLEKPNGKNIKCYWYIRYNSLKPVETKEKPHDIQSPMLLDPLR